MRVNGLPSVTKKEIGVRCCRHAVQVEDGPEGALEMFAKPAMSLGTTLIWRLI
jgi:hypothetical protein